MLTHPNGIFRETVFRPLGVLAPQIFIRTTDWPRLASAPPNGDGGPPPPKKKFKGEHLKFGLKFRVWAPITLGLVTGAR